VADVGVGDFVFHHAGLALQRLRAEEAATVLEALAILDELFAELEDTQEAA
jgi:hydrogenase maturation factor